MPNADGGAKSMNGQTGSPDRGQALKRNAAGRNYLPVRLADDSSLLTGSYAVSGSRPENLTKTDIAFEAIQRTNAHFTASDCRIGNK
jgi:hypothetical protein